MSFTPGENVGPYRILEQLGQGGMASVFKAYHAALDRYVAIKVLHPAFKEDPNFISRFEREAKVVAKLEHPNIVPVYDYAEHNGQPYLVMKYIEGVTLKARLTEGPLTKEIAVEIAEAIGGALAYAHKKGVLHRDIKPSNVLLSNEGAIFLADFGLARIAQAGASTLSRDVMMGTPQYISPEQAKGNHELDEGTDIYSLGVVLYELVVGRVPFNADTPFSIIHDHIYKALPLPSKVNPRVPANVERVLLKALDKSREGRFASVDDLVKAFRHVVLGGEEAIVHEAEAAETKVVTQVAQKEPTRAAQETPGKRRRWPWVLGGIGLTLVCLFAFIVFANNREGDPDLAPPNDGQAEQDTQALPADLLEDLSTVRDPHVHFERAKRLEQNDRPILASQSYFRAGELFLDEQIYPEALESFLRSLELGGLEIERPERAEERFTEALFMAASEMPIYEYVERLNGLVPEWEEMPLFLARTEIYHGDLEVARQLATEFLRDHPEHPLGMTIMAEVHIVAGEYEQAKRLIEVGKENVRSLPDWLRDHIFWLESQLIA
jgi:hypothetical protein